MIGKEWKSFHINHLFSRLFKENDEKERTLALEKQSHAHLYNLNPDPMLTGMIVHLLKQGV